MRLAYHALVRRRCLLLSLGLLACNPGARAEPRPSPTPDAAKASPMPSDPTPGDPTKPTPSGRSSNLKSDEEARIFPAIGHREGNTWEIRVHGWVYEPESDTGLRATAVDALRLALELPDEAPESDIFRARARAFLVDNESMKSLLVRIGGEEHELASTSWNGHTDTDVIVAAAAVRPDATGIVPIEVITRPNDPRRFGGVAFLLENSGVSVISDIDDTVKISEVRDKQKLLRNTFMHEFQPVAGMADAYRRWAAAGAAFHYVSASPWQLFDPIDGFFKAANFPPGSLHLKQFRWKDSSFFSLFQDPVAYKKPILAALLTRFPGRRFVLVGDSGEQDPEVYGIIYREFPDQVAAIYIRDVTAEPREAARYTAAFAEVPGDRWTLFTDPATLPATLPAGPAGAP